MVDNGPLQAGRRPFAFQHGGMPDMQRRACRNHQRTSMPPNPRPPTPPDPDSLRYAGFAEDWVRTVLATVPVSPGATAQQIADARDAALILLDSLGARDPVGAMLAAEVVAAQAAILESLRQAAVPGVPVGLACRLGSVAASLMRRLCVLVNQLQDAESSGAREAVPGLQDMRALAKEEPAIAVQVAVRPGATRPRAGPVRGVRPRDTGTLAALQWRRATRAGGGRVRGLAAPALGP
jgi:hypothetical protein